MHRLVLFEPKFPGHDDTQGNSPCDTQRDRRWSRISTGWRFLILILRRRERGIQSAEYAQDDEFH
jgi:hypothetical protein